jgi:hypothetical protein
MTVLTQTRIDFSSNGTLLRNGPYCGAFYKDSNGDNKHFIVVAFKVWCMKLGGATVPLYAVAG